MSSSSSVVHAPDPIDALLSSMFSKHSVPTTDVDKYAKVLKENLLTSPEHVLLLEEHDVDALLALPLLVRRLLKNYLRDHKAKVAPAPAVSEMSSSKQSKKLARQRSDTVEVKSVAEVVEDSPKSSMPQLPAIPALVLPSSIEFASKYVNFSEKERDLLASHLKTLTKENFDGVTSSASDFYQQFWSKWVVQDPVAAGLHETFSMTQRIKYVSNILNLFFTILKDPAASYQRISDVAVVHAIWNISPSSFGCMASSWANAIRQVLGSSVVDDAGLELWEKFIKQLGAGHIFLFDSIVNVGRTFDVFHRSKDKWNRVVAVLHDKMLMVYKEGTDPALAKAKMSVKAREVLELANFVEAYTIDDDSLPKKTEYCIVLESGTTKEYFCLKSKSDQTDFLKELMIRISTLSRMIKVDALLPGKYFSPDDRRALLDRRRDVDEEPERVLQSGTNHRDAPSISPKGNRTRAPVPRTPSSVEKRSKSAKPSRMSMPKTSVGDFFSVCNEIAAPILSLGMDGEVVYTNAFSVALIEEATGTRDFVGDSIKDLLTEESYGTMKDVIKKSQSQRVQTAHLKFRSKDKDSDKSKAQLFNAQISLAETLGEKYLIITLGSKPVSTSSTSTYTRFEARQESVLVISEGGTILYANKRSQHFTGISPEKLVGNSLNWLMPQAMKSGSIDWTQLLKHRSLALETVNGGLINGQLEKEDGGYAQATYVWIEVPDSARGTIQEKIRSTLEVISDLPLPTMICDSAGVILGLNDLAEDLFGFSSSELLSRNFSSLLPKHSSSDDAGASDFFKPSAKRASMAALKQFQTKDGLIKNLRVATSERVQAGSRFYLFTFTK